LFAIICQGKILAAFHRGSRKSKSRRFSFLLKLLFILWLIAV
jgi:hypothetical protein